MGTSKNRKVKKPGISSKIKTIPLLDWSESDKNHSTLKKIEKASQEEKEFEKGEND